MSKQEIFRKTLIGQGVGSILASQAAEVLASDDPSKPNLGRTLEQQQVINQLWQQVTGNGK